MQNDELHYALMRQLEQNPKLSQRQLASRFNVSLGKINYCLNALIDKGLVKMENFYKNPQKIQYIYILTPAGVQEKLKLTRHFLGRKIQEYDQLATEIAQLKNEVVKEEINQTAAAPDMPHYRETRSNKESI